MRIAPRYFAYHDRNEVHDPALAAYASQVRARLISAEAPWTPGVIEAVKSPVVV